MRTAELHRLIENLIRLGTIAEVDHASARVRVRVGQLKTTWIPWQAARAGEARVWDPPTVGEQVILLSPGGDPTAGIALAGVYSANQPAPASQPGLHRRQYPDGTVIDYDQAAHKLTITVAGDVDLNVQGNLNANVGGTAALNAGGTVTVDAPQIEHNKGTGVVTGECICHFTGQPHGDISTTVKAGK